MRESAATPDPARVPDPAVSETEGETPFIPLFIMFYTTNKYKSDF